MNSTPKTDALRRDYDPQADGSGLLFDVLRQFERQNAELLAALRRIRRLDQNTHHALRWDLIVAISDAAISKAEE